MGKHFTFEISVHFFAQRHVLGITQIGIRQWLAFALAFDGQHDLALGIALGPFDGDGAVAESRS